MPKKRPTFCSSNTQSVKFLLRQIWKKKRKQGRGREGPCQNAAGIYVNITNQKFNENYEILPGLEMTIQGHVIELTLNIYFIFILLRSCSTIVIPFNIYNEACLYLVIDINVHTYPHFGVFLC